MRVFIYQPAKTAMQSGTAKTQNWLLEFEAGSRFIEPMMGWSGSRDTSEQLKLRFENKEEALAYAAKHQLEVVEREPHVRAVLPKAYANNFAANRKKYADPQ